ncbi:MAG: aminotransferase-like domain-containing protein [Wenzhouxiangella sp.]
MTRTVNLSVNVPPLGRAAQALAAAMADLAADPAECRRLAGYGDLGGSQALQATISRWLATIRPDQSAHADDWVACDGALGALFLVLSQQLKPGDSVLLESPGYPALKDVVRALKLKPVPVGVDRDGMLPESLAAAAAESGARCAVMVPSLQNPTGVNYPAQRRRDLAQVCRDRAIVIIEDDVYAGLDVEDANQMPSLHSLLPDQCIYIGGASKALMPGLRVAWIRPLPGQRDALLERLWPRGLGVPQPGHALFARLVASGHARELLDDCRDELAQRNRLADRILGERLWPAASAWCPHRWWPGSVAVSIRRHAQAASRGIVLPAPDAFTLRPQRDHVLRLCLGAATDMAELESALTTLACLPG